LRERERDLVKSVVVFEQARGVQEQAVPRAVQLRCLHAQRYDDTDRLFEVQLTAARAQLLEAGAKGSGSN
jgi:hypothetical protein